MIKEKRNLMKPTMLFVAVLLIYLLVPVFFHDYNLLVINYGLFAAILVYGVSVLLGMGGQLSFASISFMGGGAYFVANMCSARLGFGMQPFLALILAVVLFAIIGFLLGLVLFKLSGTYFTFATIAVVAMTYTFFLNYKPLFGGAEGISKVAALSLLGFTVETYEHWFYVLFTVTIVVALCIERIRRTQLGRSLAAIRDNETAAKTLGVNVYMTKVIAFTITAALGALSGALYCFHGKYAVSDLFTYNNATQYIIMAMLGGVNNTIGIFVGSMLVKIIPEVFRQFESYVQLFWGIAIILLMIFMPDGFAGLTAMLGKKIRSLVSRKKTAKEGGAKHESDSEA